MKHYDMVIVGAGPAGATLARQLQGKYNLLLVDKRPLHKAPSRLIKNCGGLIAPDAQKTLACFNLSIPKKVLVSPQMFAVKTLDFDNQLTRTYQRHYINVDRERYDRWLVSLCDDRVDKCFSTYFKDATYFNGYYQITLFANGQHKQITADIIIGADGANSIVRRKLLQKQRYAPKRYISTQEWFPNTTNPNHYVAIFDREISDFYSWIIPKDDGIIFGSAIEEGKKVAHYHHLQKEKLKMFGYILNSPIKREGCYLLRPMGARDIYLGKENIVLIGEAAGFISPTSAEGISYAMRSANLLAEALIENKKSFFELYRKKSKSLRQNISTKMIKYPAMYHKSLRKLVLQSGIGTMKIPTMQNSKMPWSVNTHGNHL
jgi:flavin-dependent dehydrogenase